MFFKASNSAYKSSFYKILILCLSHSVRGFFFNRPANSLLLESKIYYSISFILYNSSNVNFSPLANLYFNIFISSIFFLIISSSRSLYLAHSSSVSCSPFSNFFLNRSYSSCLNFFFLSSSIYLNRSSNIFSSTCSSSVILPSYFLCLKIVSASSSIYFNRVSSSTVNLPWVCLSLSTPHSLFILVHSSSTSVT